MKKFVFIVLSLSILSLDASELSLKRQREEVQATLSSDGTKLAFIENQTNDNLLNIWDIEKEELDIINSHLTEKLFIFSYDASQVAVASPHVEAVEKDERDEENAVYYKSPITIINLQANITSQEGELKHTQLGRYFDTLAWPSGNTRFYAAYDQSIIHKQDEQKMELYSSFSPGDCTSIAWSDVNCTLAVALETGYAKDTCIRFIKDYPTYHERRRNSRTYSFSKMKTPRSLAWSENGKQLACGYDGTVDIVEIDPKEEYAPTTETIDFMGKKTTKIIAYPNANENIIKSICLPTNNSIVSVAWLAVDSIRVVDSSGTVLDADHISVHDQVQVVEVTPNPYKQKKQKRQRIRTQKQVLFSLFTVAAGWISYNLFWKSKA